MPKPPFVRPKITKFFEADMLENYQSGSFWFGTLKRYRMIEKKEAGVVVEPRFSDRREGMVEHAHNFETGHAKSVKIGGMTFTNCFFGGNGTDIMITHEFNDFVFCASWGAYSHQQHLDIKDGAMSEAGTQYEGNPNLTHFAEIDLIDFLDAVNFEAPRTPFWNTTLPASEYLLHSRVKYGQTQKSISIPSTYESSGLDVTTDDYLRTLFTKPKHFSPENEFRIVLRANAPSSIEGDPAGLKLKHKKLRRSIRKIGTLDGEE
ncbi:MULTISPECIES: hypothetical protein [Pacificibacter]|uniref:hypothetical protein n=1 Tax=Pacificibacter TaxID=1042323 RepID=UPI001C0A3086|nr:MULTISPECIES: hypothetical protein [Pacificibacter]MBU2937017.1 hypothetical protein [Pacificibacter marinus]MDO6616518.1 hypothetical protein [Pacificibacter sp. 1_MG-2023]